MFSSLLLLFTSQALAASILLSFMVSSDKGQSQSKVVPCKVVVTADKRSRFYRP